MCAVCAGIRRRAFLAGMAEAFLHIQRKVVSSSSSPPAAVRDCLIRWRCLVNCPRFLLSYVPLFLPLSLPDSVAEFPFSSLINHPPPLFFIHLVFSSALPVCLCSCQIGLIYRLHDAPKIYSPPLNFFLCICLGFFYSKPRLLTS
jgi:hypothetical protein